MVKLEYHDYWFMLRGKRPITLTVRAISLDAARADIRAAYGEDVEIVTCVRC